MPEHQFLVVTGTGAQARMGSGAAFTAWREPTTLLVGEHVESFAPVDAYQLMVEAVSSRIEGEDAWCVPMTDSLHVAQVLADVAAAGSAG
jgi:hypothetical protein